MIEFLNLFIIVVFKYFVKPSARFSFDLMYFNLNLFNCISSLMWWYLSSICLDFGFTVSFSLMWIAALLSTFMVIQLYFNFNTVKMFSYHKQHFAHSSIPQYSLSAVETATQCCNFEYQEVGVFPTLQENQQQIFLFPYLLHSLYLRKHLMLYSS